MRSKWRKIRKRLDLAFDKDERPASERKITLKKKRTSRRTTRRLRIVPFKRDLIL